MVQFIRSTLLALAILCAQNLQAFESHIAYFPTISLRYANHLIWGEYQYPFYNSQNKINFSLESDHSITTKGIGYQYHHNNMGYYGYCYTEQVNTEDYLNNYRLLRDYTILNFGLGLSSKQWSLGFNFYLPIQADQVNILSHNIQNNPLIPCIKSINNQNWGIDSYFSMPVSQSVPYSRYMQGYIGVFYHPIEQHIIGMIPSTGIYLRNLSLGNFTKNTPMAGMTIGIELFSKISLQVIYDNFYSKRIMLKANSIDIPFSIHSTCHKPRIKRYIGSVMPHRSQSQPFSSLNLKQYTPCDSTSANMKTNISRFKLNQWVTESFPRHHKQNEFDRVVASSFIRLEKESRIMLQALAISKSKPHLPDEICVAIGRKVLSADIFKANALLDNEPIRPFRVIPNPERNPNEARLVRIILFPMIKPIPNLYQGNSYELTKITEALFSHYRNLHHKKLKNSADSV